MQKQEGHGSGQNLRKKELAEITNFFLGFLVWGRAVRLKGAELGSARQGVVLRGGMFDVLLQ